MLDDVGNVQDGTIVGWDFCIGGEKEMPTSSAMCAGFAEITGIAVDGKDHVAGIVCENCIVLGGDVVKDLFRVMECVQSGFGEL